MNDSYITVRSQGHGETVIQKSRFIGYAAPCETEEEAQSIIRSLREMHRDAKHHCYGYIVGLNSGIMRYSDDGEPGGTAGLPIMNVLRGEKVVNCCVVVVRYFGGILLGTGGLVRAYTEGCKTALKAAGLVRMEMTSLCLCEVPYSAWDQVRYGVQEMPVRLDSVEYGVSVSFRLCARTETMPMVLDSLQNRTGRRLTAIPLEDQFMDWDLRAEDL